jgi:hypothetical protein
MAMARTVEQGFAEFASRLTPTSTERDAAVRHRRSVEKALSERLEVVTFLQTGSFWHGTGVRAHADIDLLVWLKFQSQPTSSYDALTFVEKSLAAAFPSTSVYISRPAVVVNFANGDERWEVIPGYTTGQDDVVEIPSGEFGGGWMNTSPSGHFRYVNEANSSPRPAGGAKALSRLLKAWKYYNSVPISSFYLEYAAAQHMMTQGAYIPIFDLPMVLRPLVDRGLAPFQSPDNAGGPITACSSAADLVAAKDAVIKAWARADLAKDAHVARNASAAFVYLDMLFNGKFPAR